MQSNSSRRHLIVDDDHEDLSQEKPAGNVTSSKLQEVQFELPETATKDNIVAESSIIQEKAAVSTTTIITRSSEKSVQSNSKGRRGLIVDDEREDLSQATPAGNVTSSKLQAVQFELPETSCAITSLNRPSPSPSISTALIAQELIQQSFEQNEVALIQTTHNSLITDYPFTNSNAISIIKEEGSSKELIGMMVKDYLISEEENARGNFDHIVHSIKLFKELGWSFHDFFIGFEEMVMTVRKNLLEGTPLIQDSTVVAIKKVVISKSREGRIAVNVPETKNSYKRARQFITTFSLQIFELFQVFHKYKDTSLSDLSLSIAQLWPWVSITYEEMSDLISILRDCIGQINAEDQLLINLSGLGFLHLREELFKEFTSNCELARCVLNNEKQSCINNVEKYIASVLKKEFSFGKRNSERMWKFLGEFYACNFTNSFKQSAPLILETSVTESSSTPLKLSSLTKSINEIGSADSKKRKERDLDSSVRNAGYALRSLRSGSSGEDNSGGGGLDADMEKLREAREKARVKARARAAAAKARAKASTEKKKVVVEKKKRKLREDSDSGEDSKKTEENVSDSDKDEEDEEEDEEEKEEGKGKKRRTTKKEMRRRRRKWEKSARQEDLIRRKWR